MIYEDVFEKIDVISLFRNGKLVPLKFKWNERTYSIRKINGSWVCDEGINRLYHYSVTSEGPDCFEIVFDSRNMSWELSRVCLEG